MTTTNEAAERLRQWLAVDGRYVDAHPLIDNLVDAALAAERKATVERIREALLTHASDFTGYPTSTDIDFILDSLGHYREAAR